jgi:hypothetical protein
MIDAKSSQKDFGSVQIVHSEHCRALILVHKECETLWFPGRLVARHVYVHDFAVSANRDEHISKQRFGIKTASLHAYFLGYGNVSTRSNVLRVDQCHRETIWFTSSELQKAQKIWTRPPGNLRASDQLWETDLWETDRLDNDKGALGIWDRGTRQGDCHQAGDLLGRRQYQDGGYDWCAQASFRLRER